MATVIFGRMPHEHELAIPRHPTLDSLDEQVAAGHVLIPHVEADDPLGIVPEGMAHFNRNGKQINPEDRPPIHAVDNPFRAAFMSHIYYRSYRIGLPYNAAISPHREAGGMIVGYQCYMSDPLKDALGRIGATSTFVTVVERDANKFTAAEPPGQGNSYYSELEPSALKRVARFTIDMDVLGTELIDKAEDPIVNPMIRSYYKQMGVRGAEIAAYEQP